MPSTDSPMHVTITNPVAVSCSRVCQVITIAVGIMRLGDQAGETDRFKVRVFDRYTITKSSEQVNVQIFVVV
jgi:hypothetical protein